MIKLAWIWRHAQDVSYLLHTQDARFETLSYMARQHHVLAIAPSAEGWGYQMRRSSRPESGQFLVAAMPTFDSVLQAVEQFAPDVIVCEGGFEEPEWAQVFERFPSTYTCLYYGGGPFWNEQNDPFPMTYQWQCIQVPHEVQRQWLKNHDVPRVVRGWGPPPHWFRPLGLPKQLHVFCPGNFAPGKRPALVAEALERLPNVDKPSLFSGQCDNLSVLEHTRVGGIPMNNPGPARNGIIFSGRVPQPLMPWVYNLSEVVVLGSQEEGHPNASFEALLCGTPAIVMSDCEWLVAEAHQQLIDKGFIGWSLQVVEPNALAISAAIEQAMQRAVPASARAAVLAEYHWWRMYEATDRMIRTGLGLWQAGQIESFPDDVGHG